MTFKDTTTVSGLVMISALSQRLVSIAIEADQSFFNCTRQTCLQQRADQSFFTIAQDRCDYSNVRNGA